MPGLGAYFVVGGVAMVIVQGGLIGPLVKRYGEKRLAITSLLLQSITALATYLAPAFWLMFPIGAFGTGAAGLIWPTLGALIANSVPQDELGKVNGVSTALGSLMSVFGPLWAGVVYDTLSPSAPFWMGAAIMLAGCIMLARVKLSVPAEQSLQTQTAGGL